MTQCALNNVLIHLVISHISSIENTTAPLTKVFPAPIYTQIPLGQWSTHVTVTTYVTKLNPRGLNWRWQICNCANANQIHIKYLKIGSSEHCQHMYCCRASHTRTRWTTHGWSANVFLQQRITLLRAARACESRVPVCFDIVCRLSRSPPPPVSRWRLSIRHAPEYSSFLVYFSNKVAFGT